MPDNNIEYFIKREEWRNWLEKNFDKEKEIWFTFPNKSSGKKRISYNDAVEEALCFGWIDSTIKKLDKDHSIQRFTPRKSKSNYSQPNKERLKWLAYKQMIHPSILISVEDIIREVYKFPEDIVNMLKKDQTVWDHFQKFSESYKRIRIAYIDTARNRPDEFEKRLSNFINKTRKNRLIIGHGGIDKYY